MRCVKCGQELEAGSLFCTFCGAAQPQSTPSTTSIQEPSPTAVGAPSPTAQPSAPPAQPVTPTGIGSSGSSKEDMLVMRAGSQIWDFTESEGEVTPGKRRPTIIIFEQSTHLAHTDRTLSMSELHGRVLNAVQSYEVPVEVKLVKARWINDSKESRERIVASLRGHVFQDMKVIFGLDYMGRWANIHIAIGMEPTPIEEEKPFVMPAYVKYTLIGSAAAIVLGSLIDQAMIAIAGFAAAAFGVWRYIEDRKAHAAKNAAKRAVTEIKRAAERQSRTYKIDDMRLFTTAMKSVYKAVVDDIVESGAKVVRIEGGQGGFLSGSSDQVRAPSAKLSDAGEGDV